MNYLRIIKILGFTALVIVVALSAINAFPALVGADYSFIVQSGSMEPAIPTGSVVFVEGIPPGQADERIQEGDVITFSKSGSITRTTTHRVVEKRSGEITDSVSFVTKGDANEKRDREPVLRDEIVGKVTFTVPLMGYVARFAGTSTGLAVLVILPMTLLFMDGLWQVYLAIEPEEGEE